jgi:hypothetical protein
VRLAPVPPRSSVLPPGAGNEEAKKAVKTGKQRAKKTEERSVVEVRAVQRNLDVAAIARHDDGDMAAVLAIEQTQDGLQRNMAQPTRAVRAVYEALGDDATTRTTPLALVRPARRNESLGRRPSRTPRDRRCSGGLVPVARSNRDPITSSADLPR